MRFAAATASSSERTTSLLGTGRPAEASSWFVIFLSPAMSTASALVKEVIVARIRCWYLPCPSWTSDCSFRRMNGMSRVTRLLDDGLRRGAELPALGQQDQPLELVVEVEPGLGLHEVVHEPHRELPAVTPTRSSA